LLRNFSVLPYDTGDGIVKGDALLDVLSNYQLLETDFRLFDVFHLSTVRYSAEQMFAF
jgi:hypothetical protein